MKLIGQKMKQILIVVLIFTAQSLWAQSNDSLTSSNSDQFQIYEKLISDRNIELNLKLDSTTVRCLVGDYGASSLKISVAELKNYAVFRHTTFGETEPCINAGFCGNTPMGSLNPDLIPEKIIDPMNLFERSTLNIKLFESFTLDTINRKCYRSLKEIVVSKVRGVLFKHEDGAELGLLDYDTCVSLVGINK